MFRKRGFRHVNSPIAIASISTVGLKYHLRFDQEDVSGTTLKNIATGLYDFSLASASAISTTQKFFGTASLGVVGNSSYYAEGNSNWSLPAGAIGSGYTISYWVRTTNSSMPSSTLESHFGWTLTGSSSSAFHGQFWNSGSGYSWHIGGQVYVSTNTPNMYTQTWRHIVLHVICTL